MLSRNSQTHDAFFSAYTNEIVGKTNQQFDNIYSYFELREINKQLATENSRLRFNLQTNLIAPDSTKKIFIDSLIRDSLNRYRKFTYLPARVVGNTITSQTNYLTLERGSLQGVKKGMSVISPLGVVGVVVDVSDNYSRVMSLLHRNSKVSAMLKKDNSFGSIEWDGVNPTYLTLKNISKGAKVVKGDTIVTSSYSANFPPNIMIGTVADFAVDATSNFYTLKVKTATNFFAIQYVYLVENVHYEEQIKLESTKQKGNE
jgi:rod shape-determining protein MreC